MKFIKNYFNLVTLLIYLFIASANLFANSNSWNEIKKFTALDGKQNDWFGYSVAVAGETAIIGAELNDSGANNTGAAYIFERNVGGTNIWGQLKKITPDETNFAGFFGCSVAIAGDFAVVGACGADGVTNDTGAVYIFERNSGGADNWGQIKKITASDAEYADSFGYSVDIDGNIIIVGTPKEKAYIFDKNQGGDDNWGEVEKLTPSDPGIDDWFGRSVGIATDVAVVGAANKNSASGDKSGAAYIFEQNTGGINNWGQTKKLTAADPNENDYFGKSVGIDGGVVGVGANGDSEAAQGSGAAYIFERNSGGTNSWGQTKKLMASDAGSFDEFGSSIAIAGNVIIAGAPFHDKDAGEIFAGAAYIFERNQNGENAWGEIRKLIPTDLQGSDLFGNSVAVAGGIAVAGAYQEDSKGDNAGAAYLFGVYSAEPNDIFADANPLQNNSGIENGSNTNAVTEPGETEHAGNGGPYHSVWWKWLEPTSRTAIENTEGDILIVDTHGSDFDTVLAAYTGLDVSNLTQIAANDDAGAGIQTSEVDFQFNPGITYRIVVDGKTASDTGNITLNYAVVPEPCYLLFIIYYLLFIGRKLIF